MKLRPLISSRGKGNGVVLSRTVTYAVRATVAIANCTSSKPVSAKHLASTASLPERFLPQILRKLVNKGVLHSSLGVAGGYTLSRPPEAITLWDIVDAMEGRKELTQLTVHGLTDAACERLSLSLCSIATAVQESFEMLTVAELIHCDSLSSAHEELHNS